MVSALDSGSRGPGSSLSRGRVNCSWARHFTLAVPLSTQEKGKPDGRECWGASNDGLASRPGGVGNTFSRFILRKSGGAPASWSQRLV